MTIFCQPTDRSCFSVCLFCFLCSWTSFQRAAGWAGGVRNGGGRGWTGEASRTGDVIQGGQRTADGLFSWSYHPLQLFLVSCCAASVPHSDGVRQNALNGGALGGHQQLLLQSVPSESSQEVELLLGLPHQGMFSSFKQTGHNVLVIITWPMFAS